VEANDRRYRWLVALYVLASAAFFVLLPYGTVVLLAALFVPASAGDTAGYGDAVSLLGAVTSWEAFLLVAGVGTLLVALYTLLMLSRSEKVLLRRLGAERVQRGQQRETKRALYDMAIAAGMEHPPPLYMLDSSAVNAMVLGRDPRHGAVAVTRGLAAKLDLEEERAVYAHLLTRLNARDTTWATVSTVLMHPLWIWKKRYSDVVSYREPAEARRHWAISYVDGLRRIENGDSVSSMGGDPLLLFPPYVVAFVVAHYMFEGQRRAHRESAEFADAQGMLLLKDPRAMLRALEKVIREPNHVRQCDGQYTQFFYAWTGERSSNDEEDPEYVRLQRLHQVLGAAAVGERPKEPAVDPRPPAPRLEESA
jgi:Zn-dependent protease with chaperone function